MASYRNIRFSFQGGLREAYMSILVWPLFSLFTFGILFPLAQVKLKRFILTTVAMAPKSCFHRHLL